MIFTLKRRQDMNTTVWSGGTTTQIAIFPQDASYADRKFDWRVSSAVVEAERSVFTPLPDYNRYIAVTGGEIELIHKESGTDTALRLPPYVPHYFDGGVETESIGCAKDFNLMLRKGEFDGKIGFSEGETELCFERDCVCVIYALSDARLCFDSESADISSGEAAIAEAQKGGRIAINGAAAYAWVHACANAE